MSNYTTFQRSFWDDDYILKLSRDQKLAYSYLITNDKTQQCGIYELAISKACFELSFSPEELLIHLKKFKDDKKIEYSLETQEVCIINWLKHNVYKNWQSAELVKKQLLNVKNPALVLILYDPRKPLYDGKKKVHGEIVEYKIENPWSSVFCEITDEDLVNIRAKYRKQLAISMDDKHLSDVLNKSLIPYAYPIDRVSYITDHKHNKNISKTKTKTETSDFFNSENLPVDNFEKHIHDDKTIQKIIHYSSKMKGIPTEKRLLLNIETSELMKIKDCLSFYSQEQIRDAFNNYEEIYSKRNDVYNMTPYKSMISFLINGIGQYVDESNPFELFKKSNLFQNNEQSNLPRLELLELKESAGELKPDEIKELEKLRR